MMLTDQGLRLSKSELNALLAFSSTDQASSYYGVHFKAMVPRDAQDPLIKARATDGNVAVDAFGHAKIDKDQEWFVNRAFLTGLAKIADATHSVLLKFAGASLHDAVVESSAGQEVATFSWPGSGAANSQTSFADSEEWDKRLKLPAKVRGMKSLTMMVDSLKLLAKLGAAAGTASVECYPPAQTGTDERMLVRAEGDDTTWVAVVDPTPAVGQDED